ncbi:hypothetical protein DYH10_01265 [Candidatus Saccharibacteria bacterium CPR2]|nr:hypothetical protein [Candidatus Saccharibacteria bacterium CPR2]
MNEHESKDESHESDQEILGNLYEDIESGFQDSNIEGLDSVPIKGRRISRININTERDPIYAFEIHEDMSRPPSYKLSNDPIANEEERPGTWWVATIHRTPEGVYSVEGIIHFGSGLETVRDEKALIDLLKRLF